MSILSFSELQEIVATKSALRCRHRLQPAGGEGDAVYPPTFADNANTRHNRVLDGEEVSCVLLDSVASQANRMEEELEMFI